MYVQAKNVKRKAFTTETQHSGCGSSAPSTLRMFCSHSIKIDALAKDTDLLSLGRRP